MGTISHYLTMCVPIKKSHITDWIPKWLDVFWIYSYLILLHDLTKDTSVRFLYIPTVISMG